MSLVALVAVVPVLLTQTPMVSGESPRTGAFELRLGGYKPTLAGDTYDRRFGAGAMLLFELEVERQIFQRFGSFAIGAAAGYAEKYGKAIVVTDGVAQTTPVTAAMKVVPLKLLGVYRFDWGARRFGVPLVPYGKLSLHYVPWWFDKGGKMEYVDGVRAAGAKWGWGYTAGLSFLLDFLDPRLARDFDTDMGVNHTYLFAEYNRSMVNNFGRGGGLNVDLSSTYWMFGLTLEF